MSNLLEISTKEKHEGRLQIIDFVLTYECQCMIPPGLVHDLKELKLISEKAINEINSTQNSDKHNSVSS